jgi:hypothetical protein
MQRDGRRGPDGAREIVRWSRAAKAANIQLE